MLTFKVHTVDGGLQEIPADHDAVERLRLLREEGRTGKEIVHTLLSDDWAAPPRTVVLVGSLEDGTSVHEVIPYNDRRVNRGA